MTSHRVDRLSFRLREEMRFRGLGRFRAALSSSIGTRDRCHPIVAAFFHLCREPPAALLKPALLKERSQHVGLPPRSSHTPGPALRCGTVPSGLADAVATRRYCHQ